MVRHIDVIACEIEFFCSPDSEPESAEEEDPLRPEPVVDVKQASPLQIKEVGDDRGD
jgi:hypothetical protein